MLTDILEATRIFGLVVMVWFGLVGWKLLPLVRGDKSRTDESKLGGI